MTIAPWLQPANVLQAMSSGAGLGLQQRAANQRDAEMAQRMQLAEMENARQEASAAEQLMYHRDALAQARDLALRDDDYRTAHDERAMAQQASQQAAQLLQKQSEADALSRYRQGQLKIGADRNDIQKNRGTAFTPKFHNVAGVGVVEYEPGKLKVADIPGFSGKESVPRLSIPIDPLDTAAGRLSTLANDPLINTIMGTNAPPGTGTNYVRQMPKVAQAVAPVGEDLTREEPGDDEAESRAAAAAAIQRAPSKRAKILQRLKDAGYSTEGL